VTGQNPKTVSSLGQLLLYICGNGCLCLFPNAHGPIRLAGALGYAVMAFIGGALTRKNINAIFFICFVIGIMS